MSKTRRGLSFVLCLVMVFSLFAGIPFGVLDLGTEANAVDSNTNPGDSEWGPHGTRACCIWIENQM